MRRLRTTIWLVRTFGLRTALWIITGWGWLA